MSDVLHSTRRNRVEVVGAVCAAYAMAFLPLIVLPQGAWLISLLAAGSWPLALIAATLAFVFANRIAEHPWRWAIVASASAIVLACLALQLLAGQGKLGLFGLPIAVLAPPAFIGMLKVIRILAPPADS